MTATDAVVGAVSGVDPFTQNPTLALFAAAPTAALILLTCLTLFAGPFFEEILFRGWLLGGLQEKLGDVGSILVSSLLFAIAHGSLWNAPSLFTGGCVLGWVAVRSGSVTSCILLHAMWNLTWLCRAFVSLP